MTPCWIALVRRRPKIRIDGRDQYLYRVVYELVHGPIPAGCELDHLCGDARCWNPDHLEPKTHTVHMLRHSPRTERCEAGHLRAMHSRWEPGKGWKCRVCHAARSAKSYQKRKDLPA